ncbi:hypothetical protein LCGC14_0343590 [marine sediment metagenome]|uniref:Uncharacterized protein n=1 Tax=marine sediment metagenome TaxID=412755 RepID=A0A0F9W0H6_9ZZZZ
MILAIDFASPVSSFARKHKKPRGCWVVNDTSAPLDSGDIAVADTESEAVNWAREQVKAGLATFDPRWLHVNSNYAKWL